MQESSLDKVLKEGQSLEVKFNEKQNWINTTLFKAYESILEIDFGQAETPLDEFIAIGDSVNCKFTSDGCDYLIQGWISRIKIDAPQRITVQIHKIDKTEGLGDGKSYDIFIGCIIRVDPKEKGSFLIAKKISTHTITIGLKQGIELMEKMYMELLLPDNVTFRTAIEIEKPGSLQGSKDFVAKISEPDTLNKRILENFIAELKNTESQSQEKHESFWKRNSKIGS
ncbi:MAG: hypothetical protein ACM3KR_01280 [Deltaproteobacteria bacterium]